MATHLKPDSGIVLSLREEKSMTQEELAERAGVDRRTIQRLEKGQRISTRTLNSIAKALGVTPMSLHGPRAITALLELAEELTCRYCGAGLLQRGTVDYQNVDVDYDVFACGASEGFTFRPCPKDPRFPRFTDYELEFYEEREMVYCYAIGKTEMARAVQLEQGFGGTRESAANWVERSYVATREGYDAAEAFYPMAKHIQMEPLPS
jgi:transcriptional regulator with XRE-family HTH domain